MPFLFGLRDSVLGVPHYLKTEEAFNFPIIAEKPLAAWGCRKFRQTLLVIIYICTCTAHSRVKKGHDWAVDQLAELFRTTHKVKTQHVAKSRGRHCGTLSWLLSLRTRRARCLWCWISASPTTVSEVALTLILMDTNITITI